MAENLHRSPAQGGLRTVTTEFTNLDFSTDSEVTVTISELRSVESIEDVQASAYGTGDANANEGRIVVPVSVSGNDVTLHAYVGGGAGAPLDDDTQSDVDHVVVTVRGY